MGTDQMGRLEKKIALVTGAGTGFGRAISLEFGLQGAHVFASDRDDDSNNETAKLIEEAGGSATPLHLDVCEVEDIAAALSSIGQAHGRLDILVNNAGIT